MNKAFTSGITQQSLLLIAKLQTTKCKISPLMRIITSNVGGYQCELQKEDTKLSGIPRKGHWLQLGAFLFFEQLLDEAGGFCYSSVM